MMGNTINLSGSEINFTLHAGMVIHVNKYSEARGGWGNLPVHSVLNTEVVVRLAASNDDISLHIEKLDIPVYNNQEVSLLSANGSVIGLVDLKTNKYYYTTGNFYTKLGMRIPAYWVWLIGIASAVITYLINPTGYSWIIMPFVVWIPVLIAQFRFNRKMQAAIRGFLTGE